MKLLSGLAMALVLVGAGCASSSQADLQVQVPTTKVDAAVDGLIDASAAETQAQQKEEATASRVDDDEAAINAYGQADYAAQ
jgi:hypothetical protein